MKTNIILMTGLLTAAFAQAAEYHVSTTGLNTNDGSQAKPLKTISAAGRMAQPGDEIIVHEGTYRERINPPRGGTSDEHRIVYQAAPGEKVVIKGSELVTDWEKVESDVWQVVLPNSFFGDFNPFDDLISGSWFHRKGRDHHTGAVYLNGRPLAEAAQKEQLFNSDLTEKVNSGYLFNIDWMRTTGSGQTQVSAAATLTKQGTKTAPTDDGGECLGFIKNGDYATYAFDFEKSSEHMEFRTATALQGGLIEIRMDSPEGKLLGTCTVSDTGGWQTWRTIKAPIDPTSGKKTICLVFKAKPVEDSQDTQLWFAEVGEQSTTVWAQFKQADPNQEQVEVNARQTVFYPTKTGINYITVKGFTLEHAATPWSPPNAEQIGLIGTHWSKGWIIENNIIRHSICVGVTLGKYGDEFDNIADTADGYVGTIKRALKDGNWSKETIGSHLVRNNTIHDCGAAGICGSLGGAFSAITGNHIYNIHIDKPFGGFEQAAIKFHAPIDCLIANNRIHDSTRGIWLDWMTQGTRVSGNLCYRNPKHDLFLEVNHGPFVVDNNLLLSGTSMTEWSEGGAYAHNLFAGKMLTRPEKRETPYHKPHSTELAGISSIAGGDNRFHNNILTVTGLDIYNASEPPMTVDGNVYLQDAIPFDGEAHSVHKPGFNPGIKLIEEQDAVYLEITLPETMATLDNPFVTSGLLGKIRVGGIGFKNPDGSLITIDTDYFGNERDNKNPSAGPFQNPGSGSLELKVWPPRNSKP